MKLKLNRPGTLPVWVPRRRKKQPRQRRAPPSSGSSPRWWCWAPSTSTWAGTQCTQSSELWTWSRVPCTVSSVSAGTRSSRRSRCRLRASAALWRSPPGCWCLWSCPQGRPNHAGALRSLNTILCSQLRTLLNLEIQWLTRMLENWHTFAFSAHFWGHNIWEIMSCWKQKTSHRQFRKKSCILNFYSIVFVWVSLYPMRLYYSFSSAIANWPGFWINYCIKSCGSMHGITCRWCMELHNAL